MKRAYDRSDVTAFICDCSQAIDFCVKRALAITRPELVNRLLFLEDSLSEIKVSITIAWIPGHQGILFNDIADRLAKDTAHDIYTGSASAPSFITYNDVVKIAGDISIKSWQRKWNQDVSGFYTRSLIPAVGRTVLFPQSRDIGISYCRMLLHDTMLRDDSHRTGTADTPVCECGLERETAEHFLLYCPRFHEARNKLTDTWKEISDLSGRKKMLHPSETLLLAPFRDDVTNKEDKLIKEALFQFIRDTKVKI